MTNYIYIYTIFKFQVVLLKGSFLNAKRLENIYEVGLYIRWH